MENRKEPNKKKFYQYNYFYFISGLSVSILILVFFGLTSSQKSDISRTNSDETGKLFPQDYRIISPAIPSKLTFAGEKVPIDNFRIRERVDRELIINTYWHSYTLLALKRANRWFPVIEPILKQNNIPDDFKYVCIIESGLTNAVSPDNAVGFWQFTKRTAKKYGLEVNKYIDERYDVIKSTEAACKFFNDAYAEFNSWTLAAASFNFGIKGIEKQLNREHASSYYNLVLGEETDRYIPRAIALKTIFHNPEKFGYYVKKTDLYPQLKIKTFSVNHTIDDLADFAQKNGINYAVLKYYNPWMRDTTLPDRSKKSYFITLPVSVDTAMMK